ncbi:bifunctional ornithine acetyltransferase/N-acetylglutamate synthase [candidate division WOR-1 bacterium RIFOXYA12_FULL_43_27]|uniref:Arginine biosynthesis bifunctional protein ArgJ n=1 Tax=candidate division WOR-1 bacterium RIFOXYC2_FULL_46_14 TaxID=1802587 RepID=A0A1F4U514_UNCSA|nr:MAG: bifunctional ornithine acetyltransferase/N-acetylglutamate synthase [candidate division WOR-1 bacterium RIFOXYA12_FULL_43_27]OGC20645.1 MAG: bifunctional ornithine acetyltransferase/N-acetylglutamate synthase [candidate division WOR-1 bacterium RIFOXYB2_FULL_46_45]OGC31618.1 MAG: bifunctional ornithine acetyltransferase/N-acetylglutamate synthase [candidate division WOR-1 bacterium RIFOXYA2_FULL_46_56]OGC40022.1 MAG: bifunctional ornithine acetyltransferase/N-acetylglutamate synthase [ca
MITSPKGFKAAGLACGLKKSGKKDLAIIYSEVPAAAAAVFTTNKFKAAPIIVSEKQIKHGKIQAIVANAGNANAATGKRGIKDAWTMVSETARALNIPKESVLVTSTGIIGKYLPIDKIKAGIKKTAAAISKDGGHDAALSILTTDKVAKEVTIKTGGYTISGIAKGSGMIDPKMRHATMHAFIATDASIDLKTLQKLLDEAADKSFNMISVDTCMSTNDCVFVLANGLSNAKAGFKEALEKVCVELAKMIAKDGEGATQLMTVRVTGAASEKEARLAAKAIANSDLLKCAVYGRDHNPGRIYAAIGTTSARMNVDKVKTGMKFGKEETVVTCDLGVGKNSATAWGCDLTEEYININAKYHT